jgi:hypothetical protein
MTGKITLAAVATAAVVVLGACSKGDDTYNDTAAGTTAGAMATPPASYPAAGTTTGTVGTANGTIAPSDSGDSAKWTNADSLRHKSTKTKSKTP